LSSAILRSAKPASKASAVIFISGAMVASLALPASAAPLTTAKKATEPTAVETLSVAPAPLAPRSFGNIGFSGVKKPKPVPPVLQERATARVSRSTTRAPLRAPAQRSGGVLGTAAGLAGIYYIYGGTTTAGFDCSGFTQYVFRNAGISLPRTAEAQRQAATYVSNPQAGDLVFFGSPAHHVAIYAGNGMMWDSPRTGKAISLRSIYTSSVTYGRP
jgi:cell wall-associated NlpC family hydrolase